MINFFKFKRWEFIFLIIFFPIGIYLYEIGAKSTYNLKTDQGNIIKFDKENVSCKKDIIKIRGWSTNSKPTDPWTKIVNIKCRANGVLTDLTGRQYPYSSEQTCSLKKNEYIPCLAGKYFEKYNPNEKGLTGKIKILDEKSTPEWKIPPKLEHNYGSYRENIMQQGINDRIWGR